MRSPMLAAMVAASVLVSPLAALAAAAPATVSHKALSLSGAQSLAQLAADEARRLNAGGAIAVVDDGGALLFLMRLDGTFAAASSVATGKARTAAQFRRATRVFEEAIKNGRASLTAVTEMVPLQGGVPIVIDGDVVGAIGVSGAASAQQDDDIAQAAATAFQAKGSTASR